MLVAAQVKLEDAKKAATDAYDLMQAEIAKKSTVDFETGSNAE
jgi:hypothetical protein